MKRFRASDPIVVPLTDEEQRNSDENLSAAPLHQVLSSSRNSDFTLPTSNVQSFVHQSPPASTAPWRSIFSNITTYGQLPASTSGASTNGDSLVNGKQQRELWPPGEGEFSLDSAYQITTRNISQISTLSNDNGTGKAQLEMDTSLEDETDHLTIKEQRKSQGYHETIHAQSLLIGLTFLCIWSPSNLMAPHLTDMSIFFGFPTEAERDLYLGSYVAVVTGVLSLPLAAGVGFCADFFSRRLLFGATALVTGCAALATAYCSDYRHLLICRWLVGGGMGGSVPVAFSFLSDLFSTKERNTASSGLTAMMGLGIILGQVGAGMNAGYEPGQNWQRPFKLSGFVTCAMAFLCVWGVKEPIRGGKEEVLQDMLRSGTRYDRRLSWEGFCHACLQNASNVLMLWQGFFSSLPWGVIFVFLNDFLSQERGFSVPDATYLVLLFGLGCAAGGILGGYWGQLFQSYDRSYLPIFMGATTILGIFPFWGLLNSSTTNAHGWTAVLCSFGGGLVASLPSVNVRPCLINVNPPETRGASLTAANLLINIGRGLGPSCVTLLGTLSGIDRRAAFNVTLGVFWVISGIQLFMLGGTLPRDQDAMEAGLALYAEEALQQKNNRGPGDDQELFLEDGINTFDGKAARETLAYVRKGVEELNNVLPFQCGPEETGSSSEDDDEAAAVSGVHLERWRRHRQTNRVNPTEQTTLLV